MWRAVLGFGEAGNWPGAIKAVSEWFPVKERALGVGIFNAGASVGGAVAAPIIASLGVAYGWRTTFMVTGLLGFRVADPVARRLSGAGDASVALARGARLHQRDQPAETSARPGARVGGSCFGTVRPGPS